MTCHVHSGSSYDEVEEQQAAGGLQTVAEEETSPPSYEAPHEKLVQIQEPVPAPAMTKRTSSSSSNEREAKGSVLVKRKTTLDVSSPEAVSPSMKKLSMPRPPPPPVVHRLAGRSVSNQQILSAQAKPSVVPPPVPARARPVLLKTPSALLSSKLESDPTSVNGDRLAPGKSLTARSSSSFQLVGLPTVGFRTMSFPDVMPNSDAQQPGKLSSMEIKSELESLLAQPTPKVSIEQVGFSWIASLVIS